MMLNRFWFYNEQQTQHLHKPIVTIEDYFDFQLDLLDMSKYSRYNKGYQWIMICVDVFSRKAYIVNHSRIKEQKKQHAFFFIIFED